MLIRISDYLSFDDEINLFETLSNNSFWQSTNNPFENTFYRPITDFILKEEKQKIVLQGKSYSILSMSRLARSKGSDGKYHAVYIWINFSTGEYYIGKVNRDKWSQIKRYTGSGVKFKPIYNKHKDHFIRYYLFACNSEKETEEREAELVNEELLKDPFCLNLVAGGGGVSTSPLPEERREKQRQYMKEHPKRYEAMLKVAHNLSEYDLQRRGASIKKTMSDEKYKKMTKERIAKWRKEHPEEYQKAQEKSKEAQQDETIKKKRVQKIKQWKLEHPEEARLWEGKRLKAMTDPEVNKRRGESLRKWNKEHPDQKKVIGKKIGASKLIPIEMLDINTNEVIKEFSGIREAGEWLVENGKTKSVNPASHVCSACKGKRTDGHGQRQSAYGYKWRYKK